MTAAVGRVLGALADDTRRTIVTRLAEGRPLTATELAEDLPISRQAVAKHLRVLQDAGVVTAHREGRELRYRLEGAPLQAVTAWIEDVGATWDRRLAALKDQAERDAG